MFMIYQWGEKDIETDIFRIHGYNQKINQIKHICMQHVALSFCLNQYKHQYQY